MVCYNGAVCVRLTAVDNDIQNIFTVIYSNLTSNLNPKHLLKRFYSNMHLVVSD